MKFKDLINYHHWLSVELTLLNLYPDQKEIIDEYKRVFESLQMMQPVNDEMLIVLTEYECDTDDESKAKSTYVDVSGRKLKAELNSITESYAIEFVKWENWLGMKIAPETIDNFNELEIIAHCLYEMTFCGYEQEEIQEQFDSIKKTVDDYKSLTDDEKKQKTISLNDLKKKLDEKGG
jgi:hypothetical protein